MEGHGDGAGEGPGGPAATETSNLQSADEMGGSGMPGRRGRRGSGQLIDGESSALHFHAWNANEEGVKEELDRGSDPLSKDQFGQTATHLAVLANCVGALRILHEAEPQVLAGTDMFGYTPLHVAAQHGMLEMANALLEMNSDVNSQDLMGRSALHWASANSHPSVAQSLIFHHSMLSLQDREGSTPLHWACKAGNALMCDTLLYFGGEKLLRFRDFKRKLPHHLLPPGRENLRLQLSRKFTVEWMGSWLCCGLEAGNRKACLCFIALALLLLGHGMWYGGGTRLADPASFFCIVSALTLALHASLCLHPPAQQSMNKTAQPSLKDEASTSDSRPLRSKHVKELDGLLVHKFDHFCPWINNAIGLDNQVHFLIFLIVTSSWIVYLSLLQMMEWHEFLYHSHPPHCLHLVGKAEMKGPMLLAGLGILGIHQLASIVGSVLVVWQLGITSHDISKAITTNERLNGHRYRYIKKRQDGRFESPFNMGMVANLMDFLRISPYSIDWSQVYSIEDFTRLKSTAVVSRKQKEH